MNAPTLAQSLFCPAHSHLAAEAARLGAVLFGLLVVALESWLRMPIRPLFDGYAQSVMSRMSSLTSTVFRHR
jgi:hypothetical protein